MLSSLGLDICNGFLSLKWEYIKESLIHLTRTTKEVCSALYFILTQFYSYFNGINWWSMYPWVKVVSISTSLFYLLHFKHNNLRAAVEGCYIMLLFCYTLNDAIYIALAELTLFEIVSEYIIFSGIHAFQNI